MGCFWSEQSEQLKTGPSFGLTLLTTLILSGHLINISQCKSDTESETLQDLLKSGDFGLNTTILHSYINFTNEQGGSLFSHAAAIAYYFLLQESQRIKDESGAGN